MNFFNFEINKLFEAFIRFISAAGNLFTIVAIYDLIVDIKNSKVNFSSFVEFIIILVLFIFTAFLFSYRLNHKSIYQVVSVVYGLILSFYVIMIHYFSLQNIIYKNDFTLFLKIKEDSEFYISNVAVFSIVMFFMVFYSLNFYANKMSAKMKMITILPIICYVSVLIYLTIRGSILDDIYNNIIVYGNLGPSIIAIILSFPLLMFLGKSLYLGLQDVTEDESIGK